jgi:tRNA U34 2-thiouridine synthase MnmA/TrmU
MVKAIGLFSGGLDSILAFKILKELSIDTIALHIVTPFFQYGEDDAPTQQIESAHNLDVPLILHYAGEDYIEMLISPEYGYGSNMNPCIDCHLHFLKIARDVMEQKKADFVFTGEVLGERPMSQNKDALQLLEHKSGLEGRLLRPLSAKLLKPTILEEEGVIDRDRLYAIQGRGRHKQMELVKKFGITEYPSPGGGCLLTEPNFAPRVRDAFNNGETTIVEMWLLRHGRHFRLPSSAKAVVGRDEQDNLNILNYHIWGDCIIDPTSDPGPTVLLKNWREEEDIQMALSLCAYYSKGEGPYTCVTKIKGEEKTYEGVKALEDRLVRKYIIT